MFAAQIRVPQETTRRTLRLRCSTCCATCLWTLRRSRCICAPRVAHMGAEGKGLTPFRALSLPREVSDMTLSRNTVGSECWCWASVSREDPPDHLICSKYISERRKSLCKTTWSTCANTGSRRQAAAFPSCNDLQNAAASVRPRVC